MHQVTLSNTGNGFNDPNGAPLAGETVTFQLVDAVKKKKISLFDTASAGGGLVVGEPFSVTLDADGVFSTPIWPNDRGEEATLYKVTVSSDYVKPFYIRVLSSSDGMPITVPLITAKAAAGDVTPQVLTVFDAVLSIINTHINAAVTKATQLLDGLMSKEDKIKLDGVAINANNYVHPANHPASVITQDINNRFVSDAEKTTWNGKASLTSPVFAGTPTAPTASAGTNTLQVANTAFVATAISNLVASSPAALDTLNELAAALGNDPNFSTTVLNALGAKAPLASPSFTGVPVAPTAAQDTSTTQIATTEFFVNQAGTATPVVAGTPAVGTSLKYARSDHKHPSEMTYGTWTATLTGATTGPTTPVTVLSNWLRVGNLVTLNFSFSNVNTTGANGSLTISGMPWAAALGNEIGTVAMLGMGSMPGAILTSGGGSSLLIVGLTDMTAIPITAGSGKYVYGSITYRV